MTSPFDDLAAAYRGQGYAVARGAVPLDLVEQVRQVAFERWSGALDDPDLADQVFYRHDVHGSRVADRVESFAELDPLLGSFAERPELLEPTRALIGGPLWRLKDKLICKAPGVDGYGMHQDQAYYAVSGIPADRLVSVFVPLAATVPEAGPLEVAPRTHRHLLTGPGEFDPDPTLDVPSWEAVHLTPGDLGFLHPLALHRSAPNRSSVGRPVLVITYGSGPGGPEARSAVREQYRTAAKALVDAGGSGLISRPSDGSGGPPPRGPRA